MWEGGFNTDVLPTMMVKRASIIFCCQRRSQRGTNLLCRETHPSPGPLPTQQPTNAGVDPSLENCESYQLNCGVVVSAAPGVHIISAGAFGFDRAGYFARLTDSVRRTFMGKMPTALLRKVCQYTGRKYTDFLIAAFRGGRNRQFLSVSSAKSRPLDEMIPPWNFYKLRKCELGALLDCNSDLFSRADSHEINFRSVLLNEEKSGQKAWLSGDSPCWRT